MVSVISLIYCLIKIMTHLGIFGVLTLIFKRMIYYEFHSIIEITKWRKSRLREGLHFNRFCSNQIQLKSKILELQFIKCIDTIQVSHVIVLI